MELIKYVYIDGIKRKDYNNLSIYINRKILKINPDNGNIEWETERIPDCNCQNSIIALYIDGTLIAEKRLESVIIQLDLNNGNTLWETGIKNIYPKEYLNKGGVIAKNGDMLLQEYPKGFYAYKFNKSTGSTSWFVYISKDEYELINEKQFIFMKGRKKYQIDDSNGKLKRKK